MSAIKGGDCTRIFTRRIRQIVSTYFQSCTAVETSITYLSFGRFLRRLNPLSSLVSMVITCVYLLMDKPAVEKRSQWR